MICSLDQLSNIRQFPKANYRFGSDIFLTNAADDRTSKLSTGTPFQPIPEFSGTLDGYGYRIINFRLDENITSGIRGAGVFGRLAGATVKRLSIVNAYLKSDAENVGLLTGEAYNSSIERVFLSGGVCWQKMVSATMLIAIPSVGSIAGKLSRGTVLSDSYSDAVVHGALKKTPGVTRYWLQDYRMSLGGLSGSIINSRISNCYAKGSVQLYSDFSLKRADQNMGGLVGYAAGSLSSGTVSIYSSFSLARLFSTDPLYTTAGGLLGKGLGVGAIASQSRWGVASTGVPIMCGESSISGCDNAYGVLDEDPQYFNSYVNVPLKSWDFYQIWKTRKADTPVLLKPNANITPIPFN